MKQKNKNLLPITDYSSRNSGFTLLELMIVLFLAILILSLTTVFFAHTLSPSRFNATVREISATFKYARSLAQINGESQTLIIDLDSKNYSIEGYVHKNIPPDINIKVIDIFSGEIHNGKYPILFHATGGIDGGTIVLSNNRKSVTIQLDPVVGSLVIR